jgi:hypothetical protein
MRDDWDPGWVLAIMAVVIGVVLLTLLVAPL